MNLNFICKDCGQESIWEDIDLENFKKFGVEPSDICAICHHKTHLCYRNERVLYRRKCDATGENIISIYHPDSPYKVYKPDYFWSDKWNSKDFAQGFDFNRPFFEQFAELKLKVPRLAIHNVKAENSDFCNTSAGNKDSYMIFGGDYNEGCMFGILCDKNRYCLDIDYGYNCEVVYYCSDLANCYDCQYVFNSSVCHNCYFCEECSGCSECILCFNLKNKSYCIENKQYSKEEYMELKSGLITGRFRDMQALFGRFLKERIKPVKKYAHIVACQDCSGEYIVNSKNCTKCFDVSMSEDCREIIYGAEIKDCFLCDMMGIGSELCYNDTSIFNSHHACFSFWVISSSDVYYSDFCLNSHDLFGCVGINHGEFCILNKQYSEKDYREMKQKIIEHMKKTGEWGQPLPKELSCFGYNETTAGIYWPMSKEEAIKRGFNWRDEVVPKHVSQTYGVSDFIGEVKDDILDAVLDCDMCGNNYRILTQELKWYRRHNVPVPHICVNCRLKARASMRNPRILWPRECMKCGVSLQSSYAPERLEKIYCEKCYLEEVY